MDNLLELKPSSIVALFQTNKAQRKTFVTTLLDSIENGEVDPLQIHMQVKCMEDIITSLKEDKNYKDAVLNAAQTNGKSFDYQNAKIEIREAGTKYNYSACGDPVHFDLFQKNNDASAKLKEREVLLKSLPPSGTILTDEDTGETVRVYPPVKTSTTTVVVTLK